MIRDLHNRYFEPTPENIRKIGDAILIGTTSASTAVMGLPIAEHYKLYTIFALNMIGTIGKIISNFFKK